MFSQTAIYAIRALAYLAKQHAGQPAPAKAISREMEIPLNFLSKIMHRLAREGFVHSTRGINGGFILAKPAADIKLQDIVSCFMDLRAYDKCFLGLGACDGRCGMHKNWVPVRDSVRRLLRETTIDGGR
jgi:Rrf2 family protein